MKQNNILTEHELKTYIKECVRKQLNEELSTKDVLQNGNAFNSYRHGQDLADKFLNFKNLGRMKDPKSNNNGNNATNTDVQKPIQEIEKLMREGILGQKMGNKFIEYLKKFGNH